jgi:serine-type D-Ala-D-Ala endopeptidase (penicillin-binding protein 7)
MHQKASPGMSRTFKRFLHLLTLAALVAGLAPAAADAATKKATVAKRPVHATKRVYRSFAGKRQSVVRVAAVPARPSYGQLAGLHTVQDQLDLKSSVALVVDQETREVLFSKNDSAVLPIASLTKLMTGLLVSEAKLPMDEMITITQEDVDTEKHSGSRLRVGTMLPRSELLHLALMSSENRAAHALGRTYPGGLDAFVAQMNAKAKMLGMKDTGLSSQNQSSAHDLATLVGTAYQDPVLREYTTSPGYQVAIGNRTLQFNNTNRLVKSPLWEIGLQKTGYITEAGQCLVMQAKVAGRKLIMVFLDSAGKLSRIADAERVRRWVESNPSLGAPVLPSGNTVVRQVNG